MLKTLFSFRSLVALVGVFCLQAANASRVDFVSVNVVEGKIKDLNWDEEFSRYRVVSSGLGNQYSVQLFGAFRRPNWSLFFKNEPIPTGGDGVFQLNLPLPQPRNEFLIVAKGPNGDSESTKIVFYGPESKEGGSSGVESKRWFIFPALGYSSISTKQTGLSDYVTTALTAKLSINYRLKPNVWDLGISAFGTPYQITKNKNISAKYVGANLRLGYLLPTWNEQLFLAIYGGWYFSSMLVQGNQFGFQNVSGPQLYPTIRYSVASNQVLTGYLKYSPIASDFSLLKLSNREIAGGAGYTFLLENNRSISVGLDVSNLILIDRETTVETNSYTLGVQYGF